jgi:hypothetical protein
MKSQGSKVFNLPKIPKMNGAIAPWAVKSILGESDIFSEKNIIIKKYEIVEIPEDLLALSCAWHRIRQKIKSGADHNYHRITSLLDDKLFDLVQQEDKEKADSIRNYYSKKLMMLTLLEIKFTQFREDLNEFLQGNGKKFKEQFLPMVYRLPEFYETDLQFENIKSNFELDIKEDSRKFLRSRGVETTFEFMPIASLKKENKSMKRTEYWLKTKSNKFGYVLVLDDVNPLKSLWEREFKKQTIVMDATMVPKIRDGLYYYVLYNYTVI